LYAKEEEIEMRKIIKGILDIVVIMSIFEIGLWALGGLITAIDNRPILFIPLLIIAAKMTWEFGIKP
jgi:hypothetical protein